MGFIHLRNVFEKEVITFSRLSEEWIEEEARLIIKEENMGETEDQSLTIQRRYLNDEEYEELNSWRTSYP